jgi:hypothetical protein
MVIEADMSGNYVGSSTVGQRHAIGQNLIVVLHKGNWNGEQVRGKLRVQTPTATSEGGLCSFG